MRGEAEGLPLGLCLLGAGAKQRASDAQQVDAVTTTQSPPVCTDHARHTVTHESTTPARTVALHSQPKPEN